MHSLFAFLFSGLKINLIENSIYNFLTIFAWLTINLIYRIINQINAALIYIYSKLIEYTAYEVPAIYKNAVIISQRWEINNTIVVLLYTGETSIPSIEKIKRNSRWLERETAEMFNLSFTNKTDRRALFLTPILFWGVMRRDFPVGGFFDSQLSLSLGRLVITHANWGG